MEQKTIVTVLLRHIFALSLLAFSFFFFYSFSEQPTHAQFTGPNCIAGACNGKIGVNQVGNISIGTSTASSSVRLYVMSPDTAANGYAFQAVQPNGAVLFSVANNNKIGIGSLPNSSYLLSVAGNTNINGNLTISGSFNGTLPAASVFSGIFSAGNFSFRNSLGVGTSTSSTLPQTLSVYGSQYLSGALGIKTTNPSYDFDVNGTSRFIGVSRFSSFATGDSGANFDLKLQPGSSNGVVQVTNSVGSALVTVTNAGSLGIGVTNPAQKLEVVGTVKITGSGNGLTFPDGTTQTSAASASGGSVPTNYSIFGTSVTAPSGYTYTGHSFTSTNGTTYYIHKKN